MSSWLSTCVNLYELLERSQIRSLKLLERQDDNAPIQCVLQTFDLETAPEYKALSYNWVNSSDRAFEHRGDANIAQGEKDFRSITINGHEAKIRANLFGVCLTHLTTRVTAPPFVEQLSDHH